MAAVTLRPEAEPYAADRGPVGAVLCHGLTGMPGSLRDWGVALADAGLTVKAAYQLAQLWKITTADLGRINQPLLVFTSRDDHVVEPANSTRLMEQAGSMDKRQIVLEDSYHVATMDNDLPRIVEETLAF